MSKDILIPIDAQKPELADKALKIAIAQARESGGELHVMTVVPGFNMPMVAAYFPADAMENALKAVEKKLHSYMDSHIPNDLPKCLHVKNGNPYKQIIKMAKQINASMIVIPSRKHSSVDEALIGSVAGKVVERASCSVLVIRD